LNTTEPVYKNEIFEKYSKTYDKYIKEGDGFEDWNISITSNYHGMIEAGSVLEDSVYHNALFSGDGRFNNHFYAVQISDTKTDCLKMAVPIAIGLTLATRRYEPGVAVIGNTELMKTPSFPSLQRRNVYRCLV